MQQARSLPDQPEYNLNRLNYSVRGVPLFRLDDAYYYLIAAPWHKVLAMAFVGYVCINLLFAFLYWVSPGSIAGVGELSFAEAFFFSIQTFSTIGYGALAPQSNYAHMLVTIESFIGLVAVAVGTGLIFAKFARPSARVAYSNKVVIHERNGVPTLQFRIANERKSEMLNARVHVSILRDELTCEGQTMRRFHQLRMVRSSSPLFALSWTLMHEIDEDSPLHGATAETLADTLRLIVTSFEGTDTTFLQTVQARHFYRPSDVYFGAQFVDIIAPDERGEGLCLFLDRLHDIEPAQTWVTEADLEGF